MRVRFWVAMVGSVFGSACDYQPQVPPGGAATTSVAGDVSAGTGGDVSASAGGDASASAGGDVSAGGDSGVGGECKTFASAVLPVLTARCDGCHSGAGADGGLDLSADAAYGALVGVASEGDPSRARVAPGEPDRSYLIAKLEGSAGSRMPLGGAALPPATIATIREWIAAGAPNGEFGDCTDPVDPVDPIGNVTISLPGSISTGHSSIATVVAKSADGDVVSPTIVEWASADAMVAYVDDAGAVLGIRSGTTTLTATADGVESAPLTVTVTSAAMEPATLPADVMPLFRRACVRSGCHIDGDEAGDLRLDRDIDKMYDKLINEEAEESDAILVRPNDPAGSFLFQKVVLDEPEYGARMPYGGSRLAADDVAILLRWIASGAR